MAEGDSTRAGRGFAADALWTPSLVAVRLRVKVVLAGTVAAGASIERFVGEAGPVVRVRRVTAGEDTFTVSF